MIGVVMPLFSKKNHRQLAAVLTQATLLLSCGPLIPQNPSVSSAIKTVDIEQTPVKWQSIGNCWAYSHLGWAESMIKKATGQSYNFSESYLTYRHFEEQLLRPRELKEIETGGSFERTGYLLLKYGLLLEEEFIPEEAELSRSSIQAQAVSTINESLQSGPLKGERTPQVIREELNRAFGITGEQFDKRIEKVRYPKDLNAGTWEEQKLTLEEALNSWEQISWDPDFQHIPDSLPAIPAQLTRARKNLIKRVKKALNIGYPVMMNWFVDFNALNGDGIFHLETLRQNGTGRQGYHSTVMEDYVVSGLHPETNLPYATPEGESPPEIKEWAAQSDSLDYVVIKNSWGGAERFDRPSYSRFGEKGYSRLDASYLFAWIADSSFQDTPQTVINSFILPPLPSP